MKYKRDESSCKFCCKSCLDNKKKLCEYNCEKESMKCDGCIGEMNKILMDINKFSFKTDRIEVIK